MPKQRASISKDAIRTAVTTLNAKESSSQVVSKDFLRRLLTQIGDKLTDAEFEEFISDPALEVTSDGRVNIKSAHLFYFIFDCALNDRLTLALADLVDVLGV